jgi:hypothetical protein
VVSLIGVFPIGKKESRAYNPGYSSEQEPSGFAGKFVLNLITQESVLLAEEFRIHRFVVS